MTHGLAFPHPFGERLKAAKRKVQWLSAIMIVLGVIALVFPSFSTLTITYFIAFMLITFGVVSLQVPGIEVSHPSCVSKSFPDFWDKLQTIRAHMGDDSAT